MEYIFLLAAVDKKHGFMGKLLKLILCCSIIYRAIVAGG